MWFELDNPFLSMLKVQLEEFENDKLSKDLYILKTKDTLKYFERWIEEVTKLAMMKQIYNIEPTKVEPANTNFDIENKQNRHKAVEKLNKPF